jgi:hypothetical protein
MRKVIIVDDCVHCLLRNNCKEWRQAPKESRVYLCLAVGNDNRILKTCKLPDFIQTKEIS